MLFISFYLDNVGFLSWKKWNRKNTRRTSIRRVCNQLSYVYVDSSSHLFTTTELLSSNQLSWSIALSSHHYHQYVKVLSSRHCNEISHAAQWSLPQPCVPCCLWLAPSCKKCLRGLRDAFKRLWVAPVCAIKRF